MHITGAIFDMDGTLVDSLGYWNIFWSALGDRYLGDSSFRPDPATDKAIRTLPLREAMHLLHARTGFGADGDELWRLADRRCARFCAESRPYRFWCDFAPGENELKVVTTLKESSALPISGCVKIGRLIDQPHTVRLHYGLARVFVQSETPAEVKLSARLK